MNINRTLSTAFIWVLVVGGLHFLGIFLYLYWVYWWFDILTHFLGGLTIGYLATWVLFDSGFFYKTVVSKKFVVSTIFTMVVLVAIGWEVFEYIFDITGYSHQSYSLDTSLDLLMGSIGAIVSVLFRKQTPQLS